MTAIMSWKRAAGHEKVGWRHSYGVAVGSREADVPIKECASFAWRVAPKIQRWEASEPAQTFRDTRLEKKLSHHILL
jgi:hypothetical protein